MQKWMITLGLTVAVTSCTREAGYEIDQGAFGNATLNNVQVMNGELTYGQILAQRFAAEVPTQINFAFDSSQLDASAQRILLQQADWIKQFPEVRFRVYGHTDAVGSQAYNRSLACAAPMQSSPSLHRRESRGRALRRWSPTAKPSRWWQHRTETGATAGP